MKIKKIWGAEILDSRGFPTVQCNLVLENGVLIKSSVPSGASVGEHEALELRDRDENRYFGKGVLKAVENINKKIAPRILEKEPISKEIDKILLELDSTKDKSSLGANAILAVSIVVARAQAFVENDKLYSLISKLIGNQDISIPRVMFNILNGGVHANNNIPFQEFMIMPQMDSFSKDLQTSVLIYQNLKKILIKEGLAAGVGDEGGFAPNISGDAFFAIKKTLNLLEKAVELSGFSLGKDVVFCLDVAASQFYDSKKNIYFLDKQEISLNALVDFYSDLVDEFPIFSIEDALDENDWRGWEILTKKLGQKVQLVGDDIFVTNTALISKGINNSVANAVLIKPNQVGTITETLNAIKLAKNNNYNCVISHRSGETCDSFISDLAVGVGAKMFKAGAACRSERVVKYNRLLEIEKMELDV